VTLVATPFASAMINLASQRQRGTRCRVVER
jgi:hypothetical protein